MTRYPLVGRLGRGGNAEVWRARDGDREVVLKRLPRHLVGDARLSAMLRDEARLLSLASHDALPRLFAIDGSDEDPQLILELVDGPSLLEVIRASPEPLPVALSAYVMARVARALGALHNLRDERGPLGAVHRDVSPSNILLGRDGAVKLVDLGIARASGGEAPRTETGLVKGKTRFVAPEALAGGPLDARADLFSAGVVLYELLTRERLFDDDSRGPVPPPSRQRPEVPPTLDAICLRALELDSERRFQSADELASALEPLAADQRALCAWLKRREQATREPTVTRAPGATRSIGLLAAGVLVAAGGAWWALTPKRLPAVTPTPAVAPVAPSPQPPEPPPEVQHEAPPPVVERAPPRHTVTRPAKKPQPAPHHDDPLRSPSLFDPFEAKGKRR